MIVDKEGLNIRSLNVSINAAGAKQREKLINNNRQQKVTFIKSVIENKWKRKFSQVLNNIYVLRFNNCSSLKEPKKNIYECLIPRPVLLEITIFKDSESWKSDGK